MKRKIIVIMIVLLAGLGGYCGWRYYRDAWLPNRQLDQAAAAQTALFAQVKPDLSAAPRASAPAPASAPVPVLDAYETPLLPADPAPGEAPAAAADPLESLRAMNPDAVAWLTVPGTTIDYPIVQAADNSCYLRRGFDGQENYRLGCPFLDYRCQGDFTGFTSIIYAHYIPGKQEMFADVLKFNDSGFLRDHPRGELLTGDGVHEVAFFAYLTVPSNAFAYRTFFANRAEREEYVDALFENAGYTLGLTADELKAGDARLLLLSTCSYEYTEARGVLVGVLR